MTTITFEKPTARAEAEAVAEMIRSEGFEPELMSIRSSSGDELWRAWICIRATASVDIHLVLDPVDCHDDEIIIDAADAMRGPLGARVILPYGRPVSDATDYVRSVVRRAVDVHRASTARVL